MALATAAPPLPREIQVEVTGACNLACRMCLVRYRPKLGRRGGSMCFHTFRALVDALPELERVTLQGLGEPLLAPDIFEMVEYASGRGVAVGFNTNGTLLTPAASERLVHAGLDWLCVSLDGASAETYEGVRDGSDFDRVRRHVRALVETKRRLRAPKPELSLVFVAMRRNVHELPDLVRVAARWGVPKVWVQNLSHSFNDTDPAGSYHQIRRFTRVEALWADADPDASQLFDGARAVAEALGVDLRLPRLEEPPRRAVAPREHACHWPFESAYVGHDGRVQPCCMVMGADRAVLGRVGPAGFAEVWQGEAYERFRAALVGDADPPDVCRGCSLYRRVF